MAACLSDKLLYPRPLKTGDTIGVIALSSPCESQRFTAGLRYLESLGFRTKVALDPSQAYGTNRHMFSSDSAGNRAQALHGLFADEEVSAILVARGAYGSMEILPLLDFQLLRNNSKVLCGFSDTTAVLTAVYQKTRMVAVHGPSLESAFSKAAQGDQAGIDSARACVNFLQGGPATFSNQALTRFAGRGVCEGLLSGGNLTMLAHLLGTPWEPEFGGHIVLLEEAGEPPYRVHRLLLQMKLAGKFAKVKGVLLGRFSECAHPRGLGPSLADVLRDIFKDCSFPVLGFAPFGHAGVNYPWPYGICAKLSDEGLEILEPALRINGS